MAEAEAWVMVPKLDKDKTGCVLDMRPLALCKDCKWFNQAFKSEGRCLKHDNDYHEPTGSVLTENVKKVTGMPDKEKVIKALECRKNVDKRCENPCENTGLCHYATAMRGLDGEIYKPFICDKERICADAIALLKQDAVEPKQVGLYGKEDWYGLVCVCPDCKAEWMSDESETHFCPNCGQKVKWDG